MDLGGDIRKGGDTNGRKEEFLWLWVCSCATQEGQEVQVMEPRGVGPQPLSLQNDNWLKEVSDGNTIC